MRLLLLVSAGGAIGAALRLLTYQAFAAQAAARGGPHFPWATLTVNVAGSFIMGLAAVIIAERFDSSPEMRAFLMAGILGGFTTFSAFSLDAYDLYVSRSFDVVAAYIAASVVFSIAGLVAGMAVARGALT